VHNSTAFTKDRGPPELLAGGAMRRRTCRRDQRGSSLQAEELSSSERPGQDNNLRQTPWVSSDRTRIAGCCNKVHGDAPVVSRAANWTQQPVRLTNGKASPPRRQ
jgi:hypothetical protein